MEETIRSANSTFIPSTRSTLALKDIQGGLKQPECSEPRKEHLECDIRGWGCTEDDVIRIESEKGPATKSAGNACATDSRER
jgi:hypothetical protein